MKRTKIKKCAAALALALLVFIPVGALGKNAQNTAGAADGRAPGVSKEEIIYVRLGADGSAGKAYVINAFELPAPGGLTDYGGYSSVVNLTTTSPISFEDGKVRVDAPAGRFYYQGNPESITLPWIFDVGYYLDGKKTTAKAVAGAEGRVEVRLSIRENPEADENAKRFAKEYALQTEITLDASRCTGISAEGATIATAGKNKLVSFIKLPGFDADYSVSMNAVDFEMAGIQISGVRLNLDVAFDTEELTGGFDEISKGADGLDAGARSLSDGARALSEGAGSLFEGLEAMRSGMDELTGGFEAMTGGGAQLLEGSQAMRDALGELLAELDGLDETSGDLTALLDSSAGVYQAIGALSDGLTALKAELDNAGASGLWQSNEDAIASLNAQIAALQSDPVANAAAIQQLTALSQLISSNQALLAGLEAGISGNGTAANPGLAAGAYALKTQYEQFDAAIRALPSMLDEITGSLAGLRDAIGLLVQNYGELHGGFSESVAGADALFNGYRLLCEGFSGLVDGAGSLSGGVSGLARGLEEFSEGTGKFAEGVGSVEPRLTERIDGLLTPFKPDKANVGSFVSAKNTDVTSVQFVMSTEAVEKTEPDKATAEGNVKKSFWKRLLALFGL